MFENLKKALDKGKEYAFETRDKIEKAAKEFAKENNLTKEEAKKLFDQWTKKSEEARKKLEKQIVEIQKSTISKMNLVTRDDLKKLEDRIKKLEGFHKLPASPKKKAVTRKKVARKPVVRQRSGKR
jgi:polyhydroxyalkanoate synthesis regulator phasin